MWNDPKSKYLFAFEAAVMALLGNGYSSMANAPTGLKDGLWCNAHMWHGIGLDADLAAVKFVTDVIAPYHSRLITDRELATFLGE